MKLLSFACALALGALAAAPATAKTSQINVTARNFAFVPSTITLKLHQRTKLRFVGTQGMHGITIPELGVNNVVSIGPKPAMVNVTPTRTGTFVARCAVFCGAGHAKMVLTIKVVK
ncbi:MAG: cytochrome C oxidase subunit II [Candidatus Meridianibacter frigidus]|nr:MAG: cytochrome C oxidase subunit II [Candidatus Eremiobacteraeota bacterium]